MDLRPKLQLTNGYDLDMVQTARLLQWLEQNEKWNNLRAGEELGLSRIAVKSAASLARAMGFTLARSGKLTSLGQVLCSVDPYLTSRHIPWIAHYNLSADPYHLIWYKMANEIIRSGVRLNLRDLQERFEYLHESRSAYSARVHLLQELAVFIKAYADGALSRIAYLDEQDGLYIAPSSLRVPPVAFDYALLTFASRHRNGETAISIEDITSAPSSPGRVFLMREMDVLTHLERTHRSNVISIESKGHLNQVRFMNPPDPADYLLAHFEDAED